MSITQIEQGLSQKTKDKFQYGMAAFLIITAVILAFVSFIITLTVGAGVIAWGGLCMGTALTLIGGGMYFHNQLVTFETNANRKMDEIIQRTEKEVRRANTPPSRYSRNWVPVPKPEIIPPITSDTSESNYFNPETPVDAK